MSPCRVQIDSLYFHIIKGSLLKDRLMSSLPLFLQKYKKYDLRKSIPPILQGSWILSLLLFCLYRNEGRNIDKNWYTFKFKLTDVFSDNQETKFIPLVAYKIIVCLPLEFLPKVSQTRLVKFHFKDCIPKDFTSGIVCKFHCGPCSDFYYSNVWDSWA